MTEEKERGRLRAVLAGVVTVLAALLVLVALIAPNEISAMTPEAFVRLPAEALLGVLLVLVLPARWRWPVAALAGFCLGLLAIIKVFDLGFFATLSRPFDPVFDWIFVRDGVEFLNSSIGRTGTIAAVIAAIVLAVAVPVLMTLSVLRLSKLVVRHRTAAGRSVAVLGVVWVVLAVLGLQLVPGVPVAARSAAALAYGNAKQTRVSLLDTRAYAQESAVDAFADTPGANLLTGLRGKDVAFAFVESYGRTAVEDPEFATQIGAVLAAGNSRLGAAGFQARSGYLTSTTAGGGSWLAHGSLLSGLRIDTQQRYNKLVASDRMTLNQAFRKADWRTVAVMPGLTRAWPEGEFYGYDTIYGEKELGYRGPSFSWATMPDQYVLSAFQRLERAGTDRAPVMAEIPLVSSHAPWVPIPQLVGWDEIGDGSIFTDLPAAGDEGDAVWRDSTRVRTEYRRSIEYSLNSVISYVETYGDEDLVVVFLGDHQPASIITGSGASYDVPITIVAKDPAVLAQISGWGWSDGLKPGPQAPVWPMADFRDRFLTAFSSGTSSTAPPP